MAYNCGLAFQKQKQNNIKQSIFGKTTIKEQQHEVQLRKDSDDGIKSYTNKRTRNLRIECNVLHTFATIVKILPQVSYVHWPERLWLFHQPLLISEIQPVKRNHLLHQAQPSIKAMLYLKIINLVYIRVYVCFYCLYCSFTVEFLRTEKRYTSPR